MKDLPLRKGNKEFGFYDRTYAVLHLSAFVVFFSFHFISWDWLLGNTQVADE